MITKNQAYQMLLPYIGDYSEVMSERIYYKEDTLNYLEREHLGFAKNIPMEVLDELRLVDWISDDGVFKLDNRVIIPVYDASGRLLTLIGWRRGGSKYITLPSSDFSKETHFFNSDKAIKKSWSGRFKGCVVIVEGIFDALMLDSLGIPCMATMGATVSVQKGELLNLFDRVICVPDNDSVGMRAMDNWKVPFNSKWLILEPCRLRFEDAYKDIKDCDDMVNYFDSEMILGIFEQVFNSQSKIERLKLE